MVFAMDVESALHFPNRLAKPQGLKMLYAASCSSVGATSNSVTRRMSRL
jgi:hypothetical protein